jgi:Trk K+ transport system NAD-binding subunit
VRDLKELVRARSLGDLSRRHRLIFKYLGGVAGIILSYTVVYNWGMRTLEGDDHSIFRSFQTVVELMTTTGFGADAPWTTPWMNVLVVVMQLSGIGIGLFTLRLLIIPLFEWTPVRLDDRLTPKDDHVVVAEYRRDSDVLLEELEGLDVDYVLIDSDQDEAQRLSNAGYQVIQGDPESPDALRRASIEDAALVVADAGQRNASVVLTAMELNPDVRSVTLTESPSQNRAMERIGVDVAASPHALIGRRLAHKAAASVTIPEGVPVGEEVEIREILVRRESPLAGVRVRDTGLFEHPRITLVAGWFGGGLRLPPAPDDRLTSNTVLVVAGPAGAVDGVREEVSGVRSARVHSDVVIAGAGEGGSAAAAALPDDVSTTTVDVEAGTSTDVVGDVGDPETLVDAGIADATALIVTVDDDATALLAIALTRSLTGDIEILARVTDAGKVSTAFGAGGDYVLSVQRATARLLAREVYGEDVVSPVSQIRLIRTDGDRFAGRTPASVNEGADTGWVVVGVERDGAFLTDETARIDADDAVLVAGTDDMIQQFEREVAES